MYMYIGGTVDSVLIKGVTLFQRSLIERLHCSVECESGEQALWYSHSHYRIGLKFRGT